MRGEKPWRLASSPVSRGRSHLFISALVLKLTTAMCILTFNLLRHFYQLRTMCSSLLLPLVTSCNNIMFVCIGIDVEANSKASHYLNEKQNGELIFEASIQGNMDINRMN